MRCSFNESKQSQALVSFAFRSFHHPKDMVSPLFMDFLISLFELNHVLRERKRYDVI